MVPSRPSPGHRAAPGCGRWQLEPQGWSRAPGRAAGPGPCVQLGTVAPLGIWDRPLSHSGSPARGAVPSPAQCSPSDPPEQGWHHGQEVLAQKSAAPRRYRAHFPPGVKGLLGAPSQRKSPLPRVKHTLEEGNAPQRGLCPLLGPCTSHFAPGASPHPSHSVLFTLCLAGAVCQASSSAVPS